MVQTEDDNTCVMPPGAAADGLILQVQGAIGLPPLKKHTVALFL